MGALVELGNDPPRILVLSTAHQATDPRIFEKQCSSLASAGYDVTLLANAESTSTVNGVRIEPLPVATSRAQRAVGHSLRALRLAIRNKPEVCHLHDPELAVVGLLLKTLGIKVVYDVHEDLPAQVMSKYWIPRVLRQPVSQATKITQRMCSRCFNLTIAATPKIASTFTGRNVVTVRNYPILSKQPNFKSIPYGDRPCEIASVGGITLKRAVREMMEAVAMVPHESVKLILAGRIQPPGLQHQLADLDGIARTMFLGHLSRGDVLSLLGRVRAGICLLHPEPNYVDSLPTKLFEYMQAGLPVVASDFPTIRDIVQSCNCGILVDPQRPEQVADAITFLLDHPAEAQAMGKRGQSAVENYDWHTEEQVLLAEYERLVGS